MNGHWLNGMAIGIGLGWMNATMLEIPGWVNIIFMFLVAILGGLERGGQEGSA